MILVTGSSGFVGPYLQQELTAHGLKSLGTANSGQADFKLDITDKKAVDSLIKQVKPDYVIHLAGFSSVKESFTHADLCRRVNVEGTRNLLAAIKNYVPQARVLIVSSSEIYGNPQYLPVNEQHPFNPLSPYAESRVEQEELVKSSDLNWIIARSFNHIGPGQQLGFVSGDCARQIAMVNKNPKLPAVMKVGNTASYRDFSDVRDVVAAYRLLITKGRLKNIYNVCSGKAVRISRLINTLLSFSKVKIAVETDPRFFRPVEIKKIEGDNSKLKHDLNWKPVFKIEKTLRDIYQYWLKKV